jgi:hypothetical protein
MGISCYNMHLRSRGCCASSNHRGACMGQKSALKAHHQYSKACRTAIDAYAISFMQKVADGRIDPLAHLNRRRSRAAPATDMDPTRTDYGTRRTFLYSGGFLAWALYARTTGDPRYSGCSPAGYPTGLVHCLSGL